MSVEIITKEDLHQFRLALLNDLKNILSVQEKNSHKNVEWLRGHEVKKMLKISTGTLQNLRISGKLKPVRLGGIMYYSYSEIQKLLSG